MKRSYRPWLIGFFLVVIYTVPAFQSAVEFRRGGWPQALDVFTQQPSAGNLRAYERELERSSLLGLAVRPWTQYFWFRALGNPGEKAIAGHDGWLYYRPDVRYLVEPLSFGPGGGQDPVSAIAGFRDHLASRGIHLLVIPVPGKPGVYPEKLAFRELKPAPFPSHTNRLLADLHARGIEALDLAEAFGRWRAETPKRGELYLRTDTHWTPAAARRAARMAAERIRKLGWFSGGATRFTLRSIPARRVGDLLRMMELPRQAPGFAPEEVACEQVIVAGSGAPYQDDPASPILVLGDSFLRIYETDEPKAAGFIAHLARDLGTPLASIVNDGGASTLVRQQLARAPQLLAGKEVVIWEFVERDIRFGAEGWQSVSLPGPSGRQPVRAVSLR